MRKKGKWPLFEKSGAKTFGYAGPAAVKPARPKVNKVFLLLFVHKKKFSFLFLTALIGRRPTRL